MRVLPAVLACAFGAFGDRAPAQTVWTVGFGQPHGIASAASRAAHGDVLLVVSGPTAPWREGGFALGNGVTVRGPASVAGDWAASHSSRTVVAIAGPHVAHLESISFDIGDGGPSGFWSHVVEVRRGTVVFADCTFHGPVLVRPGAHVVLDRCRIVAGDFDAGLVIDGGTAELRDCTITGSDAGCIFDPTYNCVAGRPSRPGVQLISGSLHAERTTIAGGQAFVAAGGHLDASPAVDVQSGDAWISASTLRGGHDATGWPASVGATAIRNASSTPVALDAVILVPGSPNGPPSRGPVDPNASHLQATLAPEARVGATSTFTILGDPGELVALLWAPSPTPARLSAVQQPVWFAPGFVTLAGGVTDANGRAAIAIALPPWPAIRHGRIRLQAIGGNGTSIRASTLVARVVH